MPNEQKKCCPSCNFKGIAHDSPNITYFVEEYCGKPDCNCHTPTECTVCDGSGFVLGTQLCTNCTLTPTVSKWEEIEKIDINKIRGHWLEAKEREVTLVSGDMIEYGKQTVTDFSGGDDTIDSIRMVAEKVNELINALKQKLEAEHNY